MLTTGPAIITTEDGTFAVTIVSVLPLAPLDPTDDTDAPTLELTIEVEKELPR